MIPNNFRDEAENTKRSTNFGNHGYDNRLVSMRAIFGGIGPDIAENKVVPAFENIEAYQLFSGKKV